MLAMPDGQMGSTTTGQKTKRHAWRGVQFASDLQGSVWKECEKRGWLLGSTKTSRRTAKSFLFARTSFLLLFLLIIPTVPVSGEADDPVPSSMPMDSITTRGSAKGEDKSTFYPANGPRPITPSYTPEAHQEPVILGAGEPIDRNEQGNMTLHPANGIRPITPSYISKAHEEPKVLGGPRRLLVILDLNGALIYRQNNLKRTPRLRPHLAQFLSFLFQNCQVMIWSSARSFNVQKMVQIGFREYVERLDRIWSREDFRLSQSDYDKKVLTLKDLEYVWEAEEKERKDAKMGDPKKSRFRYDQTNTVIIDDNPDKCQLQPHNCIVVPEYNTARHKSGGDVELVKIRLYMETLIRQQNVSAYMRIHPFDSSSLEYDDATIQSTAVQMRIESKRLQKRKQRQRRMMAKAAATATRKQERGGILQSSRRKKQVDMQASASTQCSPPLQPLDSKVGRISGQYTAFQPLDYASMTDAVLQ